MTQPVMSTFYPGSRHKIPAADKVAPVEASAEWDRPLLRQVNGISVEFYTVGQLAMALGGRKAVTIRLWEREGTLPKSRFAKPSDDPRGRRRLYTRAQVEGLVRIAQEEGMFSTHSKPIKQTRFTERAIMLFKELGVPGR